MKYVISLVKQANQSLSCVVKGDQTYSLNISLRTMPDGVLVADIEVDGEIQRLSAICNNKMPLLSNNILGGNLYFEDIYANDSPNFEEFNDRFRLIYDTEFTIG